MDSMAAFMMGETNRGKELKVFDWNKAARLIKESSCQYASAGLQDDWGCTGGDIFIDSKPIMDGGCYLASTWAIPEIDIDGEIQDCYKMQSETDKWDSQTIWPKSALKIIGVIT